MRLDILLNLKEILVYTRFLFEIRDSNLLDVFEACDRITPVQTAQLSQSLPWNLRKEDPDKDHYEAAGHSVHQEDHVQTQAVDYGRDHLDQDEHRDTPAEEYIVEVQRSHLKI